MSPDKLEYKGDTLRKKKERERKRESEVTEVTRTCQCVNPLVINDLICLYVARFWKLFKCDGDSGKFIVRHYLTLSGIYFTVAQLFLLRDFL